jgi:hypothetical protein
MHRFGMACFRLTGQWQGPICLACQYSKANKKSHSDEQSITVNHTALGQGVSMDLMEAGIPRRIPTTRGLPSPKHYKYVTLTSVLTRIYCSRTGRYGGPHEVSFFFLGH